MDPQPPLRSTHVTASPRNLLVYDRWGRYGRPVLLLHGLLFDRTMWWPLGAELAARCTAVAPDLPAHGDTPARADYSLERVAADLAGLVDNLGLHRAPVVIAHGTAARLAEVFAGSYATHGVLMVGDPVAIAATPDEDVPAVLRGYARLRRDEGLLRTYASWLHPVPGRTRTAVRDAFPHLSDPAAFAASVTTML